MKTFEQMSTDGFCSILNACRQKEQNYFTEFFLSDFIISITENSSVVRCLNHQAMTLAGLFLENANVKILLNFYIEEAMLDLLHA